MSFSRVRKSAPCPVCGKSDWCGASSEAIVCMRVASDRPTRNGGWLHTLGDGGRRESIVWHPPPSAREYVRLNDAALDAAYTKYLNQLSLTRKHLQNLLARGMSEAEIISRGYRSAPVSSPDLPDMSGVPGFYKSYKGKWRAISVKGILIPVRDNYARIVGLQVRLDGTGTEKTSGKYRWFSSTGYNAGSSPCARVHVARPLSNTPQPGLVWITEGPIKADISAERLGVTVFGVPGVSTWRAALNLLDSSIDRVVVAYDQDMYENDAVKYNARALCDALMATGRTVAVAMWSGAKGLDDALISGIKPKVRIL